MLYIVVADGAIHGHADNLTAARVIADHVVNDGGFSGAVVFQFRDAQEVYAAGDARVGPDDRSGDGR